MPPTTATDNTGARAPYSRQDLADAVRAHLAPARCTPDPEGSGGATWPTLPDLALRRLLDRWRTLAAEHQALVFRGEVPAPAITPRMPWYTARAVLADSLGWEHAERLAEVAEALSISDQATDLYLGMLLSLTRAGLTRSTATEVASSGITVASAAAFVRRRPVEDLALLARAGLSGGEVEEIIASGVLPAREALAALAALRD